MSLDDIKEYIRRRLREGVKTLYGPSGLAGEVAKKFGLKISSAGFRVWEIVRSEGLSYQDKQTTILGEEYGKDLDRMMEEKDRERELITGGFTLEEELERQVVSNIGALEGGLKLIGRQYKTSTGIIDILAEDKNGRLVIIELKSGYADISVLSQLLKYMSAMKKEYPEKSVRGMIIAHDFDEALRESVKSFLIDKIKLVNYELKIELQDLL